MQFPWFTTGFYQITLSTILWLSDDVITAHASKTLLSDAWFQILLTMYNLNDVQFEQYTIWTMYNLYYI